MAKTIKVGDLGGSEHVVGNENCEQGWCAGRGMNFPKPCWVENCNGLIHAEFGDEDGDCNYWLYTKCDRCGEAGID